MINDSAITGAGGSFTLLSGEHPSVQMVRETVTMTLSARSYTTVVDFVFRNNGNATKVLMGFPESGSGDVMQTGKSQMLAFATWIDGAPTKAVWKPVKLDEEGRYEAHWIKEVPFAARQTRKIRVQYQSSYGGTAIGGLNRFVTYHFTGANWQGKVEESLLTIVVKRPGTHAFAGSIEPKGGEPGAVAFVQSDNTLSRSWKSWEAQADFTLGFGSTHPGWRTIVEPGPKGEAQPIPGAVILPAAKLRTLTLPGAAPKAVDWCPPALEEGGELYVGPGMLESLLGGKWSSTPESPTNTVVLEGSGHRFGFTAGKREAQVDGKSVMLAAPPKVLRSALTDEDWLYVPFSLIGKTLGKGLSLPKDARTVQVLS